MSYVSNILIVDDDPRMCDSLKLLLGNEGYEIQTRPNGMEAIEALVRLDFDLVLLDLVLPDIDGSEILNWVYRHTPETPVIVITGHASSDSVIHSLRKGAFDYLRKPFQGEELSRAIKNALAQKALRGERLLAEEALRESEGRYKALFEGAAEGILVADIETKGLKYANPAICLMLGYSEDELKQISVPDIHPKEVLEHVISEFEPQARGEKTLAENIPCLRKDGTTIYADINTTRILINGTECNVGFFTDVTERKQMVEALKEREAALEIRTSELEEVNIALRVLLRQRDKDKTELEEKVLLNVKELVMPYAEKLKKTGLDSRQMAFLRILESNLNDIVSPFAHELSTKYLSLSPTEIQVADLVKDGRTTKEISELLNVSHTTVEAHRKKIRMKMGIKNKKANLRSHLLSVQDR